MKLLQKIIKEEKGQVVVIVALAMVALLGFTALAVDGGSLYLARRQASNAADAGALAGALDLPTIAKAKATAEQYVYANNAEVSNITTPYESDPDKIEVICTKNVNFTFARVLGFTNSAVTGRAVAKKMSGWPGDSLPFLSQTDYRNFKEGDEFFVWSEVKNNGGDKESIYSFEIEYSPSDIKKQYPYCKVDYTQPIELKNGFANGQSDSDGDKKKDAIDKIINTDNIGKTFYVLSLSSYCFSSGSVWAQPNGNKDYKYVSINSLGNKDVVAPWDPSGNPQFVLLEGTLVSFKKSNQHDIKLKFTKAYDILHGDIPLNYVYTDGTDSIYSKLVD